MHCDNVRLEISDTPSSKLVSFRTFDQEDGTDLLVHPRDSQHWTALPHNADDFLVNNSEELCRKLADALQDPQLERDVVYGATRMAFWSCLCGYTESLATHKEDRYSIFPIPFQALERLIQNEFVPLVDSITAPSNSHRDTVRAISNALWAKVAPKSQVRDELHANSVYVVLRSHLDKKSLDCFGAALVTITACRLKGLQSRLTLSEDHAYESSSEGTCEVAIPGNLSFAF